jgi:hypothetical protein
MLLIDIVRKTYCQVRAPAVVVARLRHHSVSHVLARVPPNRSVAQQRHSTTYRARTRLGRAHCSQSRDQFLSNYIVARNVVLWRYSSTLSPLYNSLRGFAQHHADIKWLNHPVAPLNHDTRQNSEYIGGFVFRF